MSQEGSKDAGGSLGTAATVTNPISSPLSQATPVSQPYLAAQPWPHLFSLIPIAGWGQRHQKTQAGVH